MMKLNGNQKGFSLIELMVVVGIIGILAAIAVPNFQKFQAKSRQSEAKSNLGALYSAEKAFYAEWNNYFGAFRAIGYAPEGSLRYRVGFTAGGTMPNTLNFTGPGCTNPAAACPSSATGILSQSTQGYCATTNNTMASFCVETTFASTAALPAATVPAGNQTFTAGAAGNIDADAAFDQWTINHAKVLANVLSDIATD